LYGVDNGICRRASRSRIDSDKVVNYVTSDSLFRVKISGTTYTGSFIWLTRNQQKEAPITDCENTLLCVVSVITMQ
jgi:hypothetical protein